jgi:hypothetical protein
MVPVAYLNLIIPAELAWWMLCDHVQRRNLKVVHG